jgi:serine/threonine protein kinase
MSDAVDPVPSQPTPANDLATQVRQVVAACIEAMERGEPDPVSRLCHEQPELAERVRKRLLQLSGRVLLPTDHPAVMPQQVGPYRVVRELGGGGMGTVYLCEQREPVQRLVAVKVIKLGMDTVELLARFRLERQVLASMRHPHIAQVLDAGMSETGRPYFVMEYVDGEPITRLCDARQLAMPARLELFAQVCRAVQHAHEKGVVHRDLKPSNVLVTVVGDDLVPKVIDFGIARLIAPGADTPQQTRQDQVLGTPEYMSPEQASSGGVDVDTRTDVYSLGVVLYELLCGELPFASARLRQDGFVDLLRILQQELPTAPSTRLRQGEVAVAEARGAALDTLHRQVRGELDWIVLKALQKEREGRYASPLALAEDLERHLQHEPVLAGPLGIGYRLRKLLRRHRVEAAAAAAVLLALVVGLLVSVTFYWSERRALAAMTQAQQQESLAHDDASSLYLLTRGAVEDLLVTVGDRTLREVPRADAVRRQLLESALHFYGQLAQVRPGDPSMQRESAYAMQRMGAIYDELGRQQDAEGQFRAALAEVEGQLASGVERAQCLRLRASIRSNLGALVNSSGRADEGRRLQQQALEDLDALSQPRAAGDAALAGGVLNNLAMECEDDPHAAAALFARAIEELQRAAGDAEAGTAVRIQLAACLCNRAEALDRLGDGSGAEASMRAGIDRLVALHAANDDLDGRQRLATAHDRFAELLARHHRVAEAIAEGQQCIALLQKLGDEHPDMVEYADGHAAALHRLADLQQQSGDLAAAIATYRTAVAARERVALAHPQAPRYRLRLARTLANLGGALATAARQQQVDPASANAVYHRAQEIAAELRAADPTDQDTAATYAVIQSATAAQLDQQQDHAAAAQEYDLARQALQQCVKAAPGRLEARRQLALLLANMAVNRMRLGDLAGMAECASDGLEHARAGLQLDAADRQLLSLLAPLTARLNYARKQLGQQEDGLQAAAALAEEPLADAVGRATGAMLLANDVLDLSAGELRARWLPRTIAVLRAVLAAVPSPKGEAAALSAELCLRLVDLCGGEAAEEGEPSRWLQLAEARIAAADVAPERLCSLYGQLCQTWLDHDAAATARCAMAWAARLPQQPEAQFGAARLLAKSASRGDDASGAIGAAAVACLGAAIELGATTAAAARDDKEFLGLQKRDDFKALLADRGR